MSNRLSPRTRMKLTGSSAVGVLVTASTGTTAPTENTANSAAPATNATSEALVPQAGG